MPKWVISNLDNMPVSGPQPAPVSVIRMLKKRGVSEDKLEDYLSDSPRESYDPFLFDGIREAALKILEYLNAGKKICVYGDYDADGVTSTALLLCVFSGFSDKLCFHVPSRFKDGYGLNKKALLELSETEKPDLIVTVDCGTTSYTEVEYAKSLGMDVIVTDHHSLTEGMLPDCMVLNPHSPDCSYPFRDLSGCGVAFKLAQAIQRICAENGDSRFTKADMNQLLDLVAISTVADVVPLLGENRTLVKYGLKLINERRRPGLAVLLEELKLDAPITSDNIAYILAPHINALGRMKSADLAVDLLAGLNKSTAELRLLAREMIENNSARRAEQDRTRQLCLDAMEAGDCGEYAPVIYADGGHEGVAGIVAGNFKEKFYRPVLVLTNAPDNALKGTGRCIPGLNLHEMLAENQDLFLRFGGHSGACGFSIQKENLPLLRARMQESVRRRVEENPEILEEKLYIDKVLESEEKSIEFARSLEKMEPFGEANPRPVFCMLSCTIRDFRYMGKENRHVRFNVRSSEDGKPVSCVLFNRASEYSKLFANGAMVDVAGEIGVNEFNGRISLQMIIKDIRRSNEN